MLVIKTIMILLGLAFTLFGYLIFFRGKYNLINGFEEARRAGRKDEAYARRVGKVEFVLGILLLSVGVGLMVF